MTIKANVIHTGTAPANAGSIVGGMVTTTAAAGNASTNATLLSISSNFLLTTGAGSSGVILPPGNGTADGLAAGDTITVFNQTGQTILVYPPLGGKLNNGSANAGLSMTNGKNAQFTCLDSLNFGYILTA